MANKNNLAIVIPAYKSTFLAATLDSIAAQTCKAFTLYIGDDCSPNNLGGIVDRYKDKINLVYKRFDANLGGKDLVAQWERCIDMSHGEEWLWLFSDDDVMEKNCVEEFYNCILKHPVAQLVHFNVSVLFGKEEKEKYFPNYPAYIGVKDFLDNKLKGNIVSFVVEFVVNRKIFYNTGRFQNFDLAWGSDFVSWLKFATVSNGIFTCENVKIKWRSSGENISTNYSNEIVVRKLKAFVEYTYWIYNYSKRQKFSHPFFYSKCMFGEIFRRRNQLSTPQFFQMMIIVVKKFRMHIIPILFDGLKYLFYKNRL